MKYRVVFQERSSAGGGVASDPPALLDSELPDDVVLDAVFVGRNDPDAEHVTDDLEEDDDFMNVGTEIWEYDVAEGKEEAFQEALRRSGAVLEVEPLESADELGVS